MNELKIWIEQEIAEANKRLEELKDVPECEMGNIIDLVRIKTLKDVLEKIKSLG